MHQNTLRFIDRGPLAEALAMLPPRMTSLKARAQLLKTALQESKGIHRRQLGNGPARGLWQFELGAIHGRNSRGEWGLYVHPSTKAHLKSFCDKCGVDFKPLSIYQALEHNDVFAAGVARLNYWWRPENMPEIDDLWGSWDYYNTTWNPGKPHRITWPVFQEEVLRYLST